MPITCPIRFPRLSQAEMAALDYEVMRQIPMQLAGVALGNQPFHLAGTDAAFHITTFQDELGAHHPLQLRKLADPVRSRHCTG